MNEVEDISVQTKALDENCSDDINEDEQKSETVLLEMVKYLREYTSFLSEKKVFEKSNVPSVLIPSENKCVKYNKKLSQPIKVTDPGKIMTNLGLISDIQVCVKKCNGCEMFYRYQDVHHSIHNCDDKLFISIDICLFLREHIQEHNSITSYVISCSRLHGIAISPQSVLNGFLVFDALCNVGYDFYCKICGYHPWALVMDVNKKIAFKCAMNELEEPEDDDEEENDTVNCEEFWTNVELNIISRAFPSRKIKSLKIKPSFTNWAPFMGEKTRVGPKLFNTEYKKVSKVNGELEDDCRQMNEERILEILQNEKRT